MQARLLAVASFLAVVAASAGAAGPKSSPKKAPAAPPANSCTDCSERRPILDSKLFADPRFDKEVVPAYEVARKYPRTLDRLHCFCECQESMIHRHKTLLTCFTSDHAAGCGICLREALMAAELKEKGMSDDQIENTIESVFKTDGHRATHGPG
jgi:Pyruvate/2-oxoacid:ferredoxin oxidoreductase delta subunit